MAGKFFLGTYMTELAKDEILVEIRLPALAPQTGCAYEKLKRKTDDWATAAAVVVMRLDGGVVSQVRIALTNLAPTALRATDAANRAMAVCDPAEDLRGNAEYKAAMAGQMLRRAIAKAAARCA